MIDLRGVRWLTHAAALAACTGDSPRSSQSPAAPESGSIPGEARDTESAPLEADSPEPRPDTGPSAEILTADGWGPLRIGMTLDQITAAAGADADPKAVGGPDPRRCDEFRPGTAPPGVLVMVENGVLTRISVSRTSKIRTPEGFRVGDPAAGVLAEYQARARVDPHQYWESPAKYITVLREARAEADRRGIRYEIDAEGNIAHMRAGGPSIEYVEGCV